MMWWRCPSVSSGHPTCRAKSIQHPSVGGEYTFGAAGFWTGAGFCVSTVVAVVGSGAAAGSGTVTGAVTTGLLVVLVGVDSVADSVVDVAVFAATAVPVRTVTPMMMATSIRLVMFDFLSLEGTWQYF
jgi:hypothetical protein